MDLRAVEKIKTTLGEKTAFTGNIKFSRSLKIDGKFVGEIESPGFLYVEDGAVVEANIKVRAIVVGGIIKGNIEATERLEILPTGQVFGNIRTARLRIADGVAFEGHCDMIKDPEAIDIFATPLGKLKQAVSSL